METVRVTAIEYEVVPRDWAPALGLSPAEVEAHFSDLIALAIVRCVDRYGQKLTAIGDPGDLAHLLANGGGPRRNDLELARSRWPILLREWVSS